MPAPDSSSTGSADRGAAPADPDVGGPSPAAGGPEESGRVPELDPAVRAALPALDPDALQQFFDRYFDRVYGYVRRLVRSDHLAEDLTQDVFLHVHRSLPNYDPERPLAPWVFTIAANKVRDHWRSRRAQEDRRVVSIDEDTAPMLADEGAGPSGELSAGERTDAIAQAVADLPEMLQQTFVLRYYEELSFADIGRIVDRNETAVRKRYSRALAELRAALTADD
ncbi:MAG: RNA polymerase sigma factor [Planctomycetota bacterium]